MPVMYSIDYKKARSIISKEVIQRTSCCADETGEKEEKKGTDLF